MIARVLLAFAFAALGLLALPSAAQRGPAPVEVSMPQVPLAELPREARDTLSLVRKGARLPFAKDGAVFGNREGHLPKRPRGYYREYTVKTPGERSRGARRLVIGSRGEVYYTADHYNTFRLVRE